MVKSNSLENCLRKVTSHQTGLKIKNSHHLLMIMETSQSKESIKDQTRSSCKICF